MHLFTENCKIVNAIPAVDGNDTAITSDIISMKNYKHCTFVLTFGVVNASSSAVTGTGSESNLIAYKGEDVTTCATAFACHYRAEVTDSGDTLEALTTLATTGVSMGTGNTLDVTSDDATIVVEIDAEDLAPTPANPYDTVKIGFRFSAHSVLLSCVAVLSEPRYAQASPPTSITN